jgi:high-affinity iron transporter
MRTRAGPRLACLLALLITLCVTSGRAPAASAPPGADAAGPVAVAPTILHLLDYVAVDYPEFVKDGQVVDQGEYEEQVEFVTQVRGLLERLPDRPERAGLQTRADRLLAIVRDKRPGAEVASLAGELRRALVKVYDVQVAPRRPPELGRAPALYATHCASCHGDVGRGDGPAGRSLDPRPSNFHDRDRMAQRSVYSLYSTITLGVGGTAMTGQADLTEDERWALAFYVSNLGRTEAEAGRGAELWQGGQKRTAFPDLASVVTPSAREVAEKEGPDGVAVLSYLRGQPDRVASSPHDAIEVSQRRLRESVEAYRQGRAIQAHDLAVSGYLEGFELVEAALDALDHGFRATVEAEMIRFRGLLRAGAPLAQVEEQAAAIDRLLVRARDLLGAGALPAGATFASALVILLREGLEALLVVAALYALLVQAGRRDALPYIHIGWLVALLLGGVTWVAASSVVTISGATRELTEGLTALVAAGVLLYVGFWMHGKSHARQWQAYLSERLHGALSGRTMWTLAFVSFLAVYREAFETVLFYQALALQAGPSGGIPLAGGVLVGAGVLLLVGWAVIRGGVRLPLGIFFGAGSLLLALLAVVLAGKGIVALQEAGWLPVNPVPFPSLPLLGVYPNLESLLLQAALVVFVTAGFAWTQYSMRRAS